MAFANLAKGNRKVLTPAEQATLDAAKMKEQRINDRLNRILGGTGIAIFGFILMKIGMLMGTALSFGPAELTF